MKWFQIDNVPGITDNDVTWIKDIANNPKDKKMASWTIIPYKLSAQEMNRLSYVFDAMPLLPTYAAIITVPKASICKTHIDDKAVTEGIKQRITAINIPIQVHSSSNFQYMKDINSDVILETIDLQTPKCWRVDIPHRVDNKLSPYNRIVLSLSYTNTVDELYEIYSNLK